MLLQVVVIGPWRRPSPNLAAVPFGPTRHVAHRHRVFARFGAWIASWLKDDSFSMPALSAFAQSEPDACLIATSVLGLAVARSPSPPWSRSPRFGSTYISGVIDAIEANPACDTLLRFR